MLTFLKDKLRWLTSPFLLVADWLTGIWTTPAQFWEKKIVPFFNKGTGNIIGEEKRESAVQVNALGSIVAFILVCILPLFYFWLIPHPIIIFGIIGYCLLNIVAVIINRSGNHVAAAWTLYCVQCAAILYFGRALGSVLQLQFMVFFLIAITYQLFTKTGHRVICATLAIMTLGGLQYLYYTKEPVVSFPAAKKMFIESIAIINVLVVVFLTTRPYLKNEKLRKANHLIKLFVAQVTHEMRSPLNAIGLIAKILKKEIKKDPSLKKIEPYADMLIVGSNTTRNIVNNVLDMATIESGKTETSIEQTFFVRPFFSKLIELSQFIGKSRNMKICLLIDQVPSVITSDPLKLSQIMNNLLSNAIKYGTKNSTVTVTLSRVESNSWTIEVKNEGPPIDEKKRKTLFEPYVTGKTEVTEGTGLGLYIVRNRVLSMDGDIEINCIDDHYIVFKITLPLRIGKLKDVEPEEEEEEMSLTNLNNAKILIAEDEPSNANALSLYLEKIGCITEIAHNGRELLSKAMSQPPDIIMMDYDMPLMNGELAMRQLKESPRLKNIPVIVTTGDIFTDSVDKLLEAGADAYILKPIKDLAPLQRIISRQLHQRSVQLQE